MTSQSKNANETQSAELHSDASSSSASKLLHRKNAGTGASGGAGVGRANYGALEAVLPPPEGKRSGEWGASFTATTVADSAKGATSAVSAARDVK